MTQYSFQNKTWTEIAQYAKGETILFFPIGSTEAHGPHLPLATDSIISQEMSYRAAYKLDKMGYKSLVLPTISYSVTDFSADFPGSISLRKETAVSVLIDVLQSLIKQGFRHICVANSHLEPEHISSISIACQKVEMQTSVKIAFPDKCRRRWASRLTEEFRSGACHAGSYETSLVLAANASLVKREIQEELPPNNISLSDAIRAGITTFKEAGGGQAYFGKPAEASIIEGEQTYDILAEMLIEALKETFPNLMAT